MILVDASLKCNLKCVYCYNAPLRITRFPEPVDLDAVERKITELHQRFKTDIVLHGGEPLFWGKGVVERLLKLAHQLSGRSTLQTNGTLIDKEYIEMFRKYKTSIGLSVDGYFPCNEFRADERTTELVIKNLFWLKEEGIPVGIIALLHKASVTGKRLDLFKKFVYDIATKGITGRLNLCIHPNPEIQLTPEEAREVLQELYEFVILENGFDGFSPFKDMVNAFLGRAEVVCFLKPCAPYYTPAGMTVTSNGKVTGCHKFVTTLYLNTLQDTKIRQDILRQTDCKDCKYFERVCFGGCPAEGTGFDWRTKTRWCPAYKPLLERIEKHLIGLGVLTKEALPPCQAPSPLPAGYHRDGIEHVDGNVRHLDGFPAHTDGIEHLDGQMRHLDGYR